MRWLKRPSLHWPDRNTLIDSARLAVQSAVAAVSVVYLMRALDLPHLSWAVISALYVSQHSVDGTLGAVRGRLLGTVLGAVVGLTAVFLLKGDALTAVRLGLSALVINALASTAPGLRYGVVAAAIIALEPAADPLEGAVDRVVAIGIGSLAGAASAWLVWPQSAYARGLRFTRAALADSADLLETSIDRIDRRDADPQPVHGRFQTHIQQAHAQLAEARTRQRQVARLRRVVHAIERLWHALILFDRITGEDRGDDARIDDALGLPLRELRTQACRYLASLGGTLGRESPPAPQESLRTAVRQARERAEQRGSRSDGIETGGLAFALGELDKHLGELADAADVLHHDRRN